MLGRQELARRRQFKRSDAIQRAGLCEAGECGRWTKGEPESCRRAAVSMRAPAFRALPTEPDRSSVFHLVIDILKANLTNQPVGDSAGSERRSDFRCYPNGVRLSPRFLFRRTFEAWRRRRTKAALHARLKGLNHLKRNSTRPLVGVAIAGLLCISDSGSPEKR